MKMKCAIKACALTLGLISSTHASKSLMINADTIKKATYIQMTSKAGEELALEQFLIQGASLVRQTEPNTALWFALKEKDHVSIFDVFLNEKGRAQHFAGQVAQALKDNAAQLVEGGWDQGVLSNVHHFDILASSQFKKLKEVTTASYIVLKAKPGKSQALEQFLKEAAQRIDQTEPQTYFWLALKMDQNTYAIFDAFPNQEAKTMHFAGQVASELQKNAQRLIEGGWEQGVLANVHDCKILAFS